MSSFQCGYLAGFVTPFVIVIVMRMFAGPPPKNEDGEDVW